MRSTVLHFSPAGEAFVLTPSFFKKGQGDADRQSIKLLNQ
jgi:hypothetical protein